MATRGDRQLLTREDWTEAALDALAEAGVAGVAVDRLARRLGVSRGSFYWHFTSRAKLVEAALATWEKRNTTELISSAEAIEDPLERLRHVFAEVYEQPVDRIEISLASAPDDALVAAAFARVTRARVEFLHRIFRELGLQDGEAAARAWLAYAFYIGHHQLGRNGDLGAVAPARLGSIVDLLASGRRSE